MRHVFHICKVLSVLLLTVAFSCGYLYGEPSSFALDAVRATATNKGNLEKRAIELTEGSFVIKAQIQGELRDVKVFYLMPVEPNGKTKASANDIVLYCPFFKDTMLLKGKLPRRIAEEFGFSVYTLEIPYRREDIGVRDRYYCFAESGWHNAVFEAQLKLQATFGLEKRRLLVVGESSGGSMAEQIGVTHPDKVDAVAMVGGHYFDPLKKNHTAWLSLNTWGCFTIPAERKLQNEAKALDMQVLYAETPPSLGGKDGQYFHHAPSSTAINLIQLFIRDVARLRQENGGIMPLPESWPISKEIAGETLHFPSEELADAWSLLPIAAAKSFADDSRNMDAPVYLEPPHDMKPSGLAFFVHDPSYYESTIPMDNLYYLASIGIVAASVEIDAYSRCSFERIKRALDGALKDERYKSLPVYVIGSGIGGELAAVAAMLNGSNRIRKISTFNSEYRSPINELSMLAVRSRSELPLMMYFGMDGLMMPPRARNIEIEMVDGGGLFFGRDWFKMLAAAASPKFPAPIAAATSKKQSAK